MILWHKLLAMAPPEWLGHCTLGFPWAQGRICSMVTKIAKLPLLKVRWAHSIFHECDHLATVFVPSIGLEDVITYLEAPTKFTQQALNNS